MNARRRLSACLVASACLSAWLGHSVLGNDWPQWRGPNRTGLSQEKGLNTDWEAKPPELVWVAEGMGGGFASVAVSHGKIYTTGNLSDGQAVVALAEADGKVLWTTPVTDSVPRHSYAGSRSTPTVDGDRLYVVSSDGAIVCVTTADGQVAWKRSFKQDWNGRMMSGWGYAESPLVDGERVLCTPGGSDAMIVALNKIDGTEIWRSAVPKIGSRGGDGAGYASLIVSEGAGVKQYVTLAGRGIVSVRASDGAFLWGYNSVANGTANIPTPIASGNYIFCSSGYGTGSALLELSRDGDGVKATEVYFLDGNKLQNHHGGMVLVDDHIYCGHGHNNGFPACIDLKTGEAAWGGKRGPGSGSAAVAYYDGHLIFRYQSGDVALIEATPEAYKLKGSFKPVYVKTPSWAHPVVANGRLYLREQDKLMCYSLK